MWKSSSIRERREKMHEEIKSKLNLGNAVQNLLPSLLLSEKQRLKYTKLLLYLFCIRVKLGLSH